MLDRRVYVHRQPASTRPFLLEQSTLAKYADRLSQIRCGAMKLSAARVDLLSHKLPLSFCMRIDIFVTPRVSYASSTPFLRLNIKKTLGECIN
jgi:hypothetical protein